MRRTLLALFALTASLVPLVNGTTAAPAAAADRAGRSGYWLLGSNGAVFAFGDAQGYGDTTALPGAVRHQEWVDLEPSPSGGGYWILSGGGAIEAFGDARGRIAVDRATILEAGEEASSISVTPSGRGLWLFTSTGRVFTYGDARHFGDMSATTLNGPVLDSIPTPSGQGYYMVASDGGIFAFGDARFRGSMGGTRLNAPVEGLVPDSDGGYWLVAGDGGIFAFDAPFRGSMGGTRLNKPVAGMVRYGDGYLMVGSDGGIFNFSSLPFSGSLGDEPPRSPVVAVAAFNPARAATDPPASTSPIEQDAPQTPPPTNPASPTTGTTASTTTTTTAPPAEDPSGLTAEPTHVLPCNDGSGRSARVWYYGPEHDETSWGAQNPCRDQWIVMDFPGASASDPYGTGLSVAPLTGFTQPVNGRYQADEEGWEDISLQPEPFDGTSGCPVGYSLSEFLPDGAFHYIVSCPDADDLGWYDDDGGDTEPYDGPTCFGLEPDVAGYDGGETFAAPGGTGPWVIMGGAGDDTFRQDMYRNSMPVYFCGSGGNDTVEGYVAGFDGGAGVDTARVFNCTVNGTEPQVTNVEDITWLPCPDPS
jgi:hypothetical protein